MEHHDALRKAQNILNLAADPKTSDAERENYQNIAFDLVEKFGIDAAMLNAKASIKQKPSRREFCIDGAQAKYRMHALNNIGHACRCRMLNQNHGNYWQRNSRTVIAFGFESDLDILEMLWTSLQLQGMQEVIKLKDTRPKWEQQWDKNQTKAMRNSFWMGFGYKIRARLEEAQKGNSTPGTDLVLFDRSKEVDDAVNEAFPKLRAPTKYEIASHEGLLHGYVAGERANLYDKTEVRNNQRELA
jgi:hypothetical protein